MELELLMMSGMQLETCWAFNEQWNNKFCYKVASCWLFLLIHQFLFTVFSMTTLFANLINKWLKFRVLQDYVILSCYCVTSTNVFCSLFSTCHIIRFVTDRAPGLLQLCLGHFGFEAEICSAQGSVFSVLWNVIWVC